MIEIDILERLTTSCLIDGSPCDGIDMVIKYLDSQSKIDAMMMDFLDASRSTAAPQGRRTGGRTGRGGGRTGEPMCRVGGRTGEQDNQGGGRCNIANGGVDKVSDFFMIIAQQLQNLLLTILAQVGNHASNTQGDDFDGKGGAIAYTRDMSGCGDHQKEDFKAWMREELCLNNKMQKLESEFWYHAMVGADHAAYTDQFHELARLVVHLVTPEKKRIERYFYGIVPQIRGMVETMELTTIQSAILKVEGLTDEAIRNGSLKKNTEKRENNGEPSRDGNVRDDNKRSRTGRAFATITNPVRKEYT
nr:reverse transcriptase domain-containing protein [Tanacetum cinerariifolium]